MTQSNILFIRLDVHKENQFDLTRNVFLSFLFGIPLLLTRLVQSIIITPIYLIVSMMFENYMFGKIKVKYYSGLAEWYIEDLIHDDSGNFSFDDLMNLNYVYTELREIS